MKTTGVRCEPAVEADRKHQRHTGRLMLFSALYIAAVTRAARWIAKEARIRRLEKSYSPNTPPFGLSSEASSGTVRRAPTAPESQRKSRLAQAYDRAIEQAQAPLDGREGEKAARREESNSLRRQEAGASVVEVRRSIESLESKMGPGDDVRGREFPVVAAPEATTAELPAADQHTPPVSIAAKAKSVKRREKVQPTGEAATVMDQAAVSPDSSAESG